MQSTLLTIGIAIILALLAALIGPLFIDWEGYRATVDAEASRVAGAAVHVTGPIEVRLLPTPSVKLGDVTVHGAGAPQPVTVRQIAMEFSLAHLLRGEIHANEIAIEGAELRAELDGDGRLRLPLAQLGFDPDRLAIDRLTVENGRLRLDDAGSGNGMVLENVTFNGEVRSLAGPFKAEGTFAASGEQFGFHVATSHRGDDGAVKLRLGIDPEERAVTFETDGTLRVDDGRPRFEGDVTLSRVVGKATGGGRPTYKEPWKLTGKVKATAASARVAQFELQYGPDVRAIRGTGSAEMQFGREARIAATLSVRQIDIDRAFGSPQKQLPLEMVKALVDDGRASSALPNVPIHLDIALDNATLAGATLTSVRADLEHALTGWSVTALDLRAPGATTLHAAGKVAATAGQFGFVGPVKIDSSDPALLFAWLEGESAAGRPSLARMSGSGTVTLGAERVGVDELRAEIDGKTVQGKLSYRFASGVAPARLDATLAAGEIDFDRTIALGNAVFGPTNFTRPDEVNLALDIVHASYSGIEAANTHAVLAYDSSGLKIDQLSIGNLGDASIKVGGRVETNGGAARGSIALSLAAPRLDPILALADRFMPNAAEPLRKLGDRVSPLMLNGTLDLEPRPDKGAGPQTMATLKLDGRVAGMAVKLKASATGQSGEPSQAALRLEGRLDAAAAGTLASLLGLDTLVNADTRPASATFLADGRLDSMFRVEGHFAGTNVDASASGTLAATAEGALDVALRAADTRLPRRIAGATVPVDLRAHVDVGGEMVNVTGLSGKIAGSDVKGQFALGLDQPLRISGRIEADQADGTGLIALLTGTPAAAAASTLWSSEPFGQPPIPALEGAVEFRVGTMSWPGVVVARSLSGVLHLEPAGFSLSGVRGTVADGQLSLDAQVRRDAAGISLGSHLELGKADVPVLFAGALRVPASGRATIAADFQGQGMSPASLVGALTGAGTIEAERFEIAGLDPNAIDATIDALERDHALASNPSRRAQFAGTALDAGRLKLAGATASFTISDGRAQLIRFATPAQNSDIGGSISVGLTDGQVDVRLQMTGPPRQNAPLGERPQMSVALKGPLGAARRSTDTGALVNWVTMQRVEQEARHLEEAEKTRSRIDTAIEALRR